jgi:hypothetical protein
MISYSNHAHLVKDGRPEPELSSGVEQRAVIYGARQKGCLKYTHQRSASEKLAEGPVGVRISSHSK